MQECWIYFFKTINQIQTALKAKLYVIQNIQKRPICIEKYEYRHILLYFRKFRQCVNLTFYIENTKNLYTKTDKFVMKAWVYTQLIIL